MEATKKQVIDMLKKRMRLTPEAIINNGKRWMGFDHATYSFLNRINKHSFKFIELIDFECMERRGFIEIYNEKDEGHNAILSSETSLPFNKIFFNDGNGLWLKIGTGWVIEDVDGNDEYNSGFHEYIIKSKRDVIQLAVKLNEYLSSEEAPDA